MQVSRLLWAWLALACSTSTIAARADDAATYADCLAMIEKSADEAVTFAARWERRGGAAPAQHCRALALIAQGNVEDGAMELERAGSVLPQEDAELAAELYGQAAQAWIKVDNLDRALHDQNQALSLDGDNPALLVDRAIVLGLAERYDDALADLDKAIVLAPGDPDILAYRAAAHRRLGQPGLAEEDVAAALSLSPGLPLALLERGHLRKLEGDLDGARKDWLAVSLAVPDSALAAEAQANLEAMDLKAD